MVGSHELVHTMVGLAALDSFLPIVSTRRELIRPVHPVDSSIDMVLITGADLQYACYPVVVRLLSRLLQLVLVR